MTPKENIYNTQSGYMNKDKCCVVSVCRPYDSLEDYGITHSERFENVREASKYITKHYYAILESVSHIYNPIGKFYYTRILVK